MTSTISARDAALSRDDIARMVANDVTPGSYVNLGIGLPTLVADYLPAGAGITLHTENGMLNMGPQATGTDIDPDLINAGKLPVTELPGACFFDHAESFAMVRGRHLDVCVLGAFQVSLSGDLANWHTGEPNAIPAVGGAMDLAIGAKQILVTMSLFTRNGCPKLVPQCTYPLTSTGTVARIYTDYGVFDLESGRARLRKPFGQSRTELSERLGFDV